jgi:hypothetical protein
VVAYGDIEQVLDAVADAFRAEQGEDLSTGVRLILRDYGQAASVLNGQRTIDDLVEEAADIVSLRDPQVPGTTRTPPEPPMIPRTRRGWLEASSRMLSPRVLACSNLVAQHADEDGEVKEIRTRVLSEKFLGPLEVEPWIAARYSGQGAPTLWGPLPPPDTSSRSYDDVPKVSSGGSEELPSVSVPASHTPGQRRWLYFIRAEEGIVPARRPLARVATRVGGILDQLRLCSESLSLRYPWHAAQATTFLLTGFTPVLEPLSVALMRRQPPALTRLTLTLDLSVPPDQLVRRYQEIRKLVFAGRHRELSDKHSELAAFSSGRPPRERWAQKMEVWNETYGSTHSRWKYTQEKNFARDCRKAVQRTLGGKFAKLPPKPRTLYISANPINTKMVWDFRQPSTLNGVYVDVDDSAE